jgi:ribosomal protein S24E
MSNTVEHWYLSKLQVLNRKNVVEQFLSRDTSRSIKEMKKSKTAAQKLSKDFIEADRIEQVFGLAGAATAATIYSITYPITFVDGPLPFVDAIWLAGLMRITRTGYDTGEFIGSFFS